MTTEELREEYEVFLLFYRDIPFNRIPRRFLRNGVYGIRLVNFQEFKWMM